jgi:hypothetical protein
MTRGRKPLVALREAGQIARKRGEVRHFAHELGMICNFVIYCLGFVAHVRIKRVTRVHCSHAWIEREAADALASLRAIASGPGISRELWVYLPRGSFRFFRVEENRLIELDCYGSVMPGPEKTGLPTGMEPALIPAGISPPVPSVPKTLPGPAPSVGEIPSEKGQEG